MAEEEDPSPEEEEGPTRTDANALVPIGDPVDGGDEDDPQSLVGRRTVMHFSDPGACSEAKSLRSTRPIRLLIAERCTP